MEKKTKATVHFAGNDFFVGVTPSGHAQAIETNSDRASAASPMELLLIALGSCTAVDVISTRAIELSDTTYCSVAASLRGSAEIVTSYEIVEEDAVNVPA